MAITIITGVVLCLVVLTFMGPKMTPYTRKQWALTMTTLFVFWMPMGYYLIFVIPSSQHIDPQQVARAGALNLLIGFPLFMFVAKVWILKK